MEKMTIRSCTALGEALADLWTKDILDLVKKGKHKEAISVGVKMGLTKKYVKQIIKEYK